MNILKATEAYTLNGWIVWYKNCLSIKPLTTRAHAGCSVQSGGEMGQRPGQRLLQGWSGRRQWLNQGDGTRGRSGEETVSCGGLHKFCWVAGTSPER